MENFAEVIIVLALFMYPAMLLYTIFELENERNELPKPPVAPGYLQRRNDKWKVFLDDKSTEGTTTIYYKKMFFYTFSITDDMFHEEIMTSFRAQRRKGVHFITTSEHGKSSYITTFLCTPFSAERNALCNKIFFYHMFSLDDTTRSKSFLFIKQFSETAISHDPEVGQHIYFDRKVQQYYKEEVCLQDIDVCTEILILDPLKKISMKQPDRKHIILMDFLDDCIVFGKAMNIIQILRKLIKDLPEQFKFLLISRHQEYQFGDFDNISLDSLSIIQGGIYRKGFCVLGLSCIEDQDFIGYTLTGTNISILLFLLLCARFVKFPRCSLTVFVNLVICFFLIDSVGVEIVPITVLLLYLYNYFHPQPDQLSVSKFRFVPHMHTVQILKSRLKENGVRFTSKDKKADLVKLVKEKISSSNPSRDWFYKMKLQCDNIDINCIVDKRLEGQYTFLQSVYGSAKYKDFDSSISNLKRSFGNRKDMSEFETIYTMKQKQLPRNNKLNSLLLKASAKKQPFLCRWILFKLRNIEHNRNIEQALDIALENNDIHTARVLSWSVTNIFYKRYKQKLSSAVNIYPGVRCICKEKETDKRSFCSKSLVIVVVLQRKVRGLPQEFRGFMIEHVRLYALNRSEGNDILTYLSKKRRDSFHLKLGISNERAQNLFVNHNNLGLICPSIGKSRYFSSKCHIITDELCVQFHCTKKGIIPIGNEHFPNTINGCPTDVIQSQTHLLSTLRIGDKIGPQTSIGTLGGFVRYLDVFDCFLTCAHVMYDLKTLFESSSNFARLQGAKAYIHTPQGQVECGNVIWRAFDHDDKSRTSVDAALVVLSNANINPNDILNGSYSPSNFSDLGLSSPFLNTSCLDHEEFCISSQAADTISAGAVTKSEKNVMFPRQSDVDVQFSNTGPTAAIVNANVYQPLWIYSQAHLQLPSGFLTDRRIFRMYNQIALNLPLVQGDSGTCIYIVNHPGHKNGCIGMAVAFSGGLTLVTPLKDILKRMNIS